MALAHYFGKPVFPVRLEQTDISDDLLPYVVRSHCVEFDRVSVTGLGSWSTDGEIPKRSEGRTTTVGDSDAAWVTWAEFAPFLRIGSVTGPTPGKPDERVVGVSWDEALAFCDWSGKQLLLSPSSDGPCGDSDRPAPSMVLEWRDGGNEVHKHVVDSVTLTVTGAIRRDARPAEVGFRSVAIGRPPEREWIRVGGSGCRLGTDAPVFSRLADEFRLPGNLSGPVMHRTKRPLEVPDVEIASTCVTNEEYFAFTRTGQPWPPHWNAAWMQSQGVPFPARLRHRPVINVALRQAKAYCGWAGVRLPTWAEWQCAVTGGGARSYPWGDDYDPRLCNSQESGRGSLARVDEYGQGDTSGGLHQLSGNVFEWTIGPNGLGELVGGSYRAPCELWGLGCMFWQPPPRYLALDAGFRVVRRV